jgi:hypothetical protein
MQKANINGGNFERITDSKKYLIEQSYEEKNEDGILYLEKIFEDKKIIRTEQNHFRKYIFKYFNKTINKRPDEAYIIVPDNKPIPIKIIIVEKVDGSVEDKFLASIAIKKIYQNIFGKDFKINYVFVINDFFKTKIIQKRYMDS